MACLWKDHHKRAWIQWPLWLAAMHWSAQSLSFLFKTRLRSGLTSGAVAVLDANITYWKLYFSFLEATTIQDIILICYTFLICFLIWTGYFCCHANILYQANHFFLEFSRSYCTIRYHNNLLYLMIPFFSNTTKTT